MKLSEIKAAVESKKVVHWSTRAYVVEHDQKAGWLIACRLNGSCIGLTWADGVTLNGNESEFFVGEP